MHKSLLALWVVGCGIGLASFQSLAEEAKPPALPPVRDADVIVREYKAIQFPGTDLSAVLNEDRVAMQTNQAARQKASEQRARLSLELYEKYPDHPDAPPFMVERWHTLCEKEPERVLEEMTQFRRTHPKTPFDTAILKARATAFVSGPRRGEAEALEAVNAFAAASPTDPRLPRMLFALAEAQTDPEKRQQLHDRVRNDFPDHTFRVRTSNRQAEGAGKPFDLAFNDAASGRPISMEKLRGKVVVIDFWATWCRPCVVEMPMMKDLYARYKDKGVEFIGVSLDHPEAQGGLGRLKTFVKENGIEWPQYYQGKGWESEFSAGWEIRAVPSVFIIDAEGKLHSTEARGRLETLIPELLDKRDRDRATK